MFNLKLLGILGAALALAAAVAAVFSHFAADARLAKAHEKLKGEAETVLIATRKASENEDLEWDQVPGQVIALGESNGRLRVALELQNTRLDQMAEDAIRLRAEASELRKIADKAKLQRAVALKKLSDMAATPGTRENCMVLLDEANRALDLVKEAGL